MSLSQPINFRKDDEYLTSIGERWSKAFADLEIIENISKGEKDERSWLMECAKGLEVLGEILDIVQEEKRIILESIRYEFPRGGRFVEEEEIKRMTDEELLGEDLGIFEDYDIQTGFSQEDYFYDFI